MTYYLYDCMTTYNDIKYKTHIFDKLFEMLNNNSDNDIEINSFIESYKLINNKFKCQQYINMINNFNILDFYELSINEQTDFKEFMLLYCIEPNFVNGNRDKDKINSNYNIAKSIGILSNSYDKNRFAKHPQNIDILIKNNDIDMNRYSNTISQYCSSKFFIKHFNKNTRNGFKFDRLSLNQNISITLFKNLGLLHKLNPNNLSLILKDSNYELCVESDINLNYTLLSLNPNITIKTIIDKYHENWDWNIILILKHITQNEFNKICELYKYSLLQNKTNMPININLYKSCNIYKNNIICVLKKMQNGSVDIGADCLYKIYYYITHYIGIENKAFLFNNISGLNKYLANQIWLNYILPKRVQKNRIIKSFLYYKKGIAIENIDIIKEYIGVEMDDT